MKAARLVAPVMFAAALGACGHARSVGTEQAAAEETSPPYDKNAAAAHRPGRTAPKASEQGAVKSENGVPLPSSPAGLLKPGAAKLLQSRLAAAGVLPEDHVTGELDGPTRAALARFQAQHDLPPTGDPDDITVKKLGLDTAQVFVSGNK